MFSQRAMLETKGTNFSDDSLDINIRLEKRSSEDTFANMTKNPTDLLGYSFYVLFTFSMTFPFGTQ